MNLGSPLESYILAAVAGALTRYVFKIHFMYKVAMVQTLYYFDFDPAQS